MTEPSENRVIKKKDRQIQTKPDAYAFRRDEFTERHRQGQTDKDKDTQTQRETERITRQTHSHID
jgi:hypothetical protein